MVITPNSKVKLIKNPLKLDSNNEMMFATATAQYNYFTSLPKLEFDNLTYVRKDDVLRIPTDETGVGTTYEKLLQYNFCMYQNTAFANKWFYAFIDDVKWINPSLTEVHLKTAYYQTWQFDLVYMDSFIEREHVDDDTLGKHTIPEGLETGEYIQQNIGPFGGADLWTNYMNDFQFVVAISEWPFDQTLASVKYYNGIYSGLKYLAFNNATYLGNFLIDIQDEASGDPIYSIFVVPQFITGLDATDFDTIVSGHTSWKAAWVPESLHSKSISDDIRIADAHILDQDYVPVNNKLLVYPYRYILLNNNAGSSAEYRYELFYDRGLVNNYQTCKFKISGTIGTGCNIKIYPTGYGKYNIGASNKNLLYSLDGGKLPTCCWLNDPYVNWLTQNAVNMPLQALGNVGKIAGGLTGNIGSAISGISGIASQVSEVYAHSLEPNTAKGGVNQGDINCSDNIGFNWYRMSIKKEYAQVIDGYFNMFGYKVNRLGKPHLHVRTYYDYIKTIDVNIEGDVPEMDLEEIRKLFNRGIRFWHDTTKYLDFSVNNTIINPPPTPTTPPTTPVTTP